MVRGLSLVSLLLICGAVGSPAVLAQTVTGTVTEAETGTALATVVVALVDEAGAVRGQVLTDPRGRFTLQAPEAGSYAVRAERLGRRTVEIGPVQVDVGPPVSRDLAMEVEAISLEAIQVAVEGDTRCRLRPDEGAELARVWHHARLALQVEALGRQEEVFRFRLRDHHRDLTPDARRIEAEEAREQQRFMREPYRSAPVEELLADGWIRVDPVDGSWDYFAPDAAALLSDSFEQTHCFRLVRDEAHPGLLGVAFEPLRGGSTAGIKGALWLDEMGGVLRFLTFRYDRLPAEAGPPRQLPGLSEEALGGRVEFMELPGGAWVVRRWHIRMPRLRATTRTVFGRMQEEVVLQGIREVGGEVLEVRHRGGEVIALAEALEVTHDLELALPEMADVGGTPVDVEVEGGRRDRLGGAVQLEGLTVTATRRTAAEERELRSGTRTDVVFGEELAQAEVRGARVIDLIRRMPGVEVTQGTEESDIPWGSVCVQMRRAIRGFHNPTACEMVLVILDGARIPGGVEDLGYFLMDLAVSDFESIELLSPLQAGTRYGLDGAGGAIVLHSRGRGPFRHPARAPGSDHPRDRP